MSKYEDMLDIVYPFPSNHQRMPLIDRASQFAPFLALTGFTELIIETSREVDQKLELDENQKEMINQKLLFLNQIGLNKYEVNITYFVKDQLKNGGSYQKINSKIKKIDKQKKGLFLENNTFILLEDIIDIQSELFYQEY